jgi:hypothetical protein
VQCLVTNIIKLWVASSTCNPKSGGLHLIGCLLLLNQYIRNYAPFLKAVTSIRNLRTRHDVVTMDPLNMVTVLLTQLNDYHKWYLDVNISFGSHRATLWSHLGGELMIEGIQQCITALSVVLCWQGTHLTWNINVIDIWDKFHQLSSYHVHFYATNDIT